MKYATLLALLLVACSGSTNKKMPEFPEASSDSDEPSSGGTPQGSHAPEQCMEAGEKIECNSDKDCCPGFYCGIDPEGSTRIKTCIYGGK
jgi:hypothetical protein